MRSTNLKSAKPSKMKNTVLYLIRQSFAVMLIALFPLQYLQAQDRLEQAIPVDSLVRIGKLDNGLKYYIRKNEKPGNRVEMRLAVNAGSVLENDDQQGLAHFIEHMAFNGTKNFAKNDMVKYLQSVGVQFGPEINAYTSFDETVYMLTLPTDSAHILEKGYQIMEDWAHNLTFDDAEIDKERGVIIEEWRMGRGPQQRMEDKYIPVVFKGSKYGSRLPIGKKEIIEGAPHEKIIKFYTDWYRPDLMAFVVVGDINPDSVEMSIKKHFGKLTMPENPRFRERFKIPDQPGTTAVVVTDQEAPYTVIQVLCKNDPPDYLKLKDYRESIALQLVSSMLNQRFEELKEQANPPILYSAVQYASLGTREKSALQIGALVTETGVERGLQTVITELERAMRYGFTPGELERQKKQLYAAYETAYNERDKTESATLAAEYLRNYLTNECIPGVAFEFEFIKEYLHGIGLEEINVLAHRIFKHDNRVAIIMGPQKESVTLPGEDQVMASIGQIEKLDIEPYVDKVTSQQLMVKKPEKGNIILTKKNEALGVVEMSLSNGAKVILKPTDFKNDEILFSAFSPGGYSLYALPDHESAVNAADIVGQCGLADYSPMDLDKLLAGSVISVNSYISAFSEGINGTTTPADLESMLQLVYLGFTQPRKDSMLFVSYLAKQKGVIKNLLADPQNYFSDQFSRIKAQNNPMADYMPTEEDIDKINFDRVFEIYHERFSDASGFTFLFVGSFDIDSLKPFIETYLASLPSLNKVETWKDMGIRPPAEMVDKAIYKGNDPKSIVALYFEASEPWTPMESHMFSSLGQLLDIKYTDVLREQMSGIYGMGVNVSLVKIPYNHLEVSIAIPCSPQNADTLTKAAINEIKKIQDTGVSTEDLIKVKEAQRRTWERNLKENRFWLGQLITVYRLNDPDLITRYTDRIDAVTSKEIQAAAKKINLKKYVRVVLLPENMQN